MISRLCLVTYLTFYPGKVQVVRGKGSVAMGYEEIIPNNKVVVQVGMAAPVVNPPSIRRERVEGLVITDRGIVNTDTTTVTKGTVIVIADPIIVIVDRTEGMGAAGTTIRVAMISALPGMMIKCLECLTSL